MAAASAHTHVPLSRQTEMLAKRGASWTGPPIVYVYLMARLRA